MTNPLNGVLPVDPTMAAAQAAAAKQSNKSLLDPQAFLQLLVAQLQYQDPSNPVDTSSFMNQTATLSQVQTMNAMSSTLTALVSDQQAQAATALIGKNITYVAASGKQVTGLVTAASLGAAGATLHVGDTDVPLSGVLEVTAPPS
ncbi:MAG: flagellar hook capping protein [Pseudonocardiales bacterium]|nr:flagellar hook capping protein [Pseudonocardiales bacterium]